MILNTPLINAFQYALRRLWLLKKKKKERADIYKDMLACTCQGGGKVRIIASHFAYCEINLIFLRNETMQKNSENGNQSSRR